MCRIYVLDSKIWAKRIEKLSYVSLLFDFVNKPLSNPGGGGVHYLRMDRCLHAARFSERYPLLITETCFHTHFYDEFWRKRSIFGYFSPISG